MSKSQTTISGYIMAKINVAETLKTGNSQSNSIERF